MKKYEFQYDSIKTIERATGMLPNLVIVEKLEHADKHVLEFLSTNKGDFNSERGALI